MRLEVLQGVKNNIELSLAKEKMETQLFTKEQFLSVLRNFSLIDIKNQDGQRKIIDTFINSIYAYEDYFKIVYNGTEKEEIVSLKEIQSSTLFSEGEPNKNYPKLMPIGNGFGFLVYIRCWFQAQKTVLF